MSCTFPDGCARNPVPSRSLRPDQVRRRPPCTWARFSACAAACETPSTPALTVARFDRSGHAADNDAASCQGGARPTEEHEIQAREWQAASRPLDVAAAALLAEYGAVLVIGGCGCLGRSG